MNDIESSTKKLLQKYGISYNPSKVNIDENTKIEEKNITINQTTTNNIVIKPPENIQQGRKVSINPAVIKTRSWVASILDKQNKESEAKRKIYRNSEFIAEKQKNKLLRKLNGVTRSFNNFVNSKKAAGDRKKQLLKLFKLFGFYAIVKNWKKILGKVDEVETKLRGIVEWFGIGHEFSVDKPSGLQSFIIRMFGGEPGKESILGALKGLFMDPQRGIIPLLLKRIQIFFDERIELIKLIRIPAFKDKTDIYGMLKGITKYLINILQVLTGNDAAIQEFLSGQVDLVNANKMVEGKGWQNHNMVLGEVTDAAGNRLKDTSAGDAYDIVAQNKSGKKKNILSSSDIDDNGHLANNTRAGILQGRAIESLLQEGSTGEIHTGEVMTGMSNLKRAARDEGYVLVDPDFLKHLAKIMGLEQLDVPEECYSYYKFVQEDKNSVDRRNEGTNWEEKALLTVGMAGATHSLEGGLKVVGALGTAGSGLQAVGSKIKKDLSASKTLRLVPLEDNRAGVVIDGKNKFKFLKLRPEVLEIIERQVGNKVGIKDFKFDSLDKKSGGALDKFMTNLKVQNINNKYGKGSRKAKLRLDNLHSSYLDDVARIDKVKEIQKDAELKRALWMTEFENSRLGDAKTNMSSLMSQTISTINDFFDKTDYSGIDVLSALVGKDSYRVTSGFGSDRSWNRKPEVVRAALSKNGNPWTIRHKGVDLAASIGTPIFAPFSGTVSSAVTSIVNAGGRSITIISDDGQYKVFVCHLSNVLVNRGQHVNGGDPIGRSGASGITKGVASEKAYAPHIHVQVGYTNTNLNDLTKLTDGWVSPADFGTEGMVFGNFERFHTKESANTEELLAEMKSNPDKINNSALEEAIGKSIINQAIYDANLAIITHPGESDFNLMMLDKLGPTEHTKIHTIKLRAWDPNSSTITWTPKNPKPIFTKSKKTDYNPSTLMPEFKEAVDERDKERLRNLENLNTLWSKKMNLSYKILVSRALIENDFNTLNKNGWSPEET